MCGIGAIFFLDGTCLPELAAAPRAMNALPALRGSHGAARGAARWTIWSCS